MLTQSQPRFLIWMRTVWGWSNRYPERSCYITGFLGLVGLLAGILMLFSQATVGGGVILALIGIMLLGLVVYAAYDPNGFKKWKEEKDMRFEYQPEGHLLARTLGPGSLAILILATVIYFGLLLLVTTIIRAWASSQR